MTPLREALDEHADGAVILEPEYLDEAIIGLSSDDRIVYDYTKLMKAFMEHDGMTYDEAAEWIDFNIINAHFGAQDPIIMWDVEEFV